MFLPTFSYVFAVRMRAFWVALLRIRPLLCAGIAPQTPWRKVCPRPFGGFYEISAEVDDTRISGSATRPEGNKRMISPPRTPRLDILKRPSTNTGAGLKAQCARCLHHTLVQRQQVGAMMIMGNTQMQRVPCPQTCSRVAE